MDRAVARLAMSLSKEDMLEIGNQIEKLLAYRHAEDDEEGLVSFAVNDKRHAGLHMSTRELLEISIHNWYSRSPDV